MDIDKKSADSNGVLMSNNLLQEAMITNSSYGVSIIVQLRKPGSLTTLLQSKLSLGHLTNMDFWPVVVELQTDVLDSGTH